MGAIVRDALITDNPKIIDYAVKGRTELLDLYLTAKCSFYIGPNSGPCALPIIFRRPLIYVNVVPLGGARIVRPCDLYIPKLLWSKDKKRMLTFAETLSSGAAEFFNTDDYIKLGVEVIENTPDEIANAAIEMDERIKGTWNMDEIDIANKEKFTRIWQEYLPSSPVPPIGAAFLRKYPEWLDG
jgi:putative glycosyltransferase (TIGR04372 family)